MHMYELDGEYYPSVTTIIKLISVNDQLLKWANIMGFKHQKLETIQDDTSTFGTTVHSQLRSIVDPNAPQPIQFSDPRRKYEYSIIERKFKEYYSQFKYRTVDTEITLISKKLGFGGTADWLVNFELDDKDKLFLVDYKTSREARTTMFLQLGGYNLLLSEIGINVDGAAINIINEKACQLHPISRDTLNDYSEAFLSLASFAKLWCKFNDFKPDYNIIPVLKKQPVNI